MPDAPRRLVVLSACEWDLRCAELRGSPLAHWTLASRAGFGVELAQDWLCSAPLPASVISFSRRCAQLNSLRSISERAADLPTLTDTHSSQTAPEIAAFLQTLLFSFFYCSNKTRKRTGGIKETGTCGMKTGLKRFILS